ncbi:sel1 repeat family protein, partial [Bifidobacterium animalis]
MEDFEFLHEHEKGFEPSGEFIESRSKVPILEYGMDYYCFADIVIGPVLPAVYLTNPLFATDNEGKPHYYGRERVGRYPGGTWWDWGPDEPKSSTMRIEPVPISPVNVMGETVVPYERWVESYRNLPGTPFYSSLDDSGDYCDKASVFDPHGREAYRRAMFYMEEAMRVHRAYSDE